MTSIKILDYDVEFPYPNPYDIQKTYMEKVIHCLHNKVHGVLESPTGTGKTLCLLAPVSAWVKKQVVSNKGLECCDISPNPEPLISSQSSGGSDSKWGNKTKSMVWYTARTHSQIAQTIAEVRRCNITGLNIRVLGARDQLCIHPDVLSEKESYIKTIRCRELTKAKNCKYHRKLNHERDPRKYYASGEVMDIEDLVTVGKQFGVCPYFLSKTAIEMADIVFLPYNYVIDKDLRDANNLNFQGDVVIFDEGHNVPSTCEESYEFTFTNMDLAIGIKYMKDLMVNLAKMGEIAEEGDVEKIARHAENSVFVVEVLEKLLSGLESFEVSEELLPLSRLYEFLGQAGLNPTTVKRMHDIVEDFSNDSEKLSISGSMLSTLQIFEKMANTIFGSAVRSFDEETVNRSFKCDVRLETDRVTHIKRLSLYCFNPSFGIRGILQLGVQSIIITSGTLSPLRTFIHELYLPRPVTLQNGHIAKKCQVPFFILGTGVNNVRMDAAFTNRNDRKYKVSLGMTLTNLISSVPDGVLLLFSSYSMMQNLKEAWESDTGIWKRLNSLKRVFIEPRGKDDFISCIENYKRAVDSGNGAVLMGVLRGKVSEGMDFKDQYCRGVFIIGVPFPPTKDPRVKGKEKYSESLTYFDPVTKKEQKLYFNSFMAVEAMKATNQAIGRVIRHSADYGAIVLVDYRFTWPRLFTNISSWLRGNIPEEKNFPQAKKCLSEFFRDIHMQKLGIPEIRCQRVDGNGCPIAGYVSYQDYEHEKPARAPVPWIKVESDNNVMPKPRKANKINNIEYIDECMDNIVSLYGSSQLDNTTKGSEKEKRNSPAKLSSIFDAFESAKSLCPEYGVSQAGGNESGCGEKFKRKLNDDGQNSPYFKMSCLDGSSQSKSQPFFKKLTRIKIKPFLESDVKDPAIVPMDDFVGYCGTSSEESSKDKVISQTKRTEKDEEALKIKLVNYFRTVKDVLNEEDGKQFKNYAFRYMKGEKNFNEVIRFLDKVFDTPEKKKLFSDFSICVKSKDKELWKQACIERCIQNCL